MPPRGKTTAPKLDAKMRICVLHGTEDALKRQHLRELQASLEAAGDVQVITFEGATVELVDVLDEMRDYGLMQQHKIVIVDEADAFLVRHRAAIERYAENPVDTATLVLRANKWNAGNLDKLIKKVGCIIKCSDLSPAEAADWLVERAREEHASKLDRKTAAVLVQRIGSDLMRLDTEVAKLALVAGKNQPITTAMIDEMVGRASEESAWVVQEAVLEALIAPRAQGSRPAAQLLAKVYDLVAVAKQPEIVVTYFVADTLRKLYQALLMRREGAAPPQIFSQLKLWGPRQRMFMAALERHDERTIGELLDRIVNADQGAKSGRGNSLRNLECFCASLTDVR